MLTSIRSVIARCEWFRDSLLYWSVALFFNAFPLPQTETGARQSLRYIGDLVGENWSVLFFPEGERTGFVLVCRR